MKTRIVSASGAVATFGLLLALLSTGAQAACIQGKDGGTYTCAGDVRWNFDTGKWYCTVAVTGETVAGEKVDCHPDAGTDDDLLEPLVRDGGRPGRGVVRPGDPRKRLQQPK